MGARTRRHTEVLRAAASVERLAGAEAIRIEPRDTFAATNDRPDIEVVMRPRAAAEMNEKEEGKVCVGEKTIFDVSVVAATATQALGLNAARGESRVGGGRARGAKY